MHLNKQWYALFLRAGWEKKVRQQFRRNGVICFAPFVGEPRRQLFGKKTGSPFPNILFIRIHKNEIEKVSQVPGVVNLLYWLSQPAVFPASVIEMLRDFLFDYQILRKETVPFQPGTDTSCFQLHPSETGSDTDEARLILPCFSCMLIGKRFKGATGTSLKYLPNVKEKAFAV